MDSTARFTRIAVVVATLIILCLQTALGDAGAERITLYPIVKAPPGASQGYLIATAVRSMVEDADQSLEEMGEIGQESVELAVFARYTVLEPSASGDGRLLVEAMALDRATLRPVALPRWQGVLRLAPAEPAWEDGATPEWVENFGVSLDWLREWMIPPKDAPAEPIAVGERWEATVLLGDDSRFDGLELDAGEFTVFGEFEKYARPGATAPPVASIIEVFSGRLDSAVERTAPAPWCMEELSDSASFDIYTRWIEECLESVVAATFPTAMDIEGFSRILLVEGDFPWGGQSSVSGTLSFVIDDAPGVTFSFTTEVMRYEGSFEQGAIEPLSTGEPQAGALGSDSWSGTRYGLPSGAPADIYTFWGEAGDGALIEMAATDFAPYLVLMDEEWDVIAESYDVYDSDQVQVFAVLPYSGAYFVQATTSSDDGFGAYTIALETGPDIVAPPDWGMDDWWNWDDLDFDWDFDWDDGLSRLDDVHVFAMESCASVPLAHESVSVINDRQAFLDALRHDGARESCHAQLETPDFDRYVLVGVGIDSGWCGMPPGLQYEVWLDEAWGEVVIYVDYEWAETTCPSSSPSELWLLVERPPDDVDWDYVAYTSAY